VRIKSLILLRPSTNRGRRRAKISVDYSTPTKRQKSIMGGDATFDFILTNIILKLTIKRFLFHFFV